MFFKKVACFTDIHFGMKGNSRIHNDDCEAFVKWFIAQAKAENKSIDQVGIRFMRFCGKYDLNRISEQAQLYVEPFNAKIDVNK